MKKNLFTDYDGFVEKFKPKKTTDDCYTPEKVYYAVLDWVRNNCDIEDCEIVRPFYPGGDYENFDYPENCVVIDNPPFSRLSEIARFYASQNVRYFLFAPHLTLFSITTAPTAIVTSASVIYANGANVLTSFVSNLFGNRGIIGAADLRKAINIAQNSDTQKLPKYVYPDNIVTVSRIAKIISRGISISIPRTATHRIAKLKSQGSGGGIFGSGFLVSNSVAKELAAKELAAKELAAKELAAKELAAKTEAIEWPLSAQEIEVIKLLDQNENRTNTQPQVGITQGCGVIVDNGDNR